MTQINNTLKITDSTLFYEKINYNKLNHIINNKEKYKDIIENEEKLMRRNKNKTSNVSVWTILNKIMKSCIIVPNTEYAYIPVTYKKGKSSNDIGRWYADKSIGLGPLCSCIRHTICDGIWTDIDQVNSHPTIMKSFMEKYNFNSTLLNKCFEDREMFLKTIMDEEKCSRDEAKTCVISCINGGKFKTNTLKKLIDELKPCINHVIELDEYRDVYNYCRREYSDNLSNLSGKVISRILQIVENNLLEHYIDYCLDREVIPKYKNGYQVSLIFDGFQLINNNKINDEFIDNMRQYALEKTGYNIPLKIKPFDNKFELPDNYYEFNIPNDESDTEDIDDDIKEYSVVKKEFEKDVFKVLYPPMIIYEKREDVQPLSMKSARETYSHLSCWQYQKEEKKIKQFFTLWSIDPKIRKFEKICWKPPPLICNELDYNSWKNIKISNEPLVETERNYWNEFQEYSNNLFGDTTISNYILARYAYRIQNAGLRTYVCVIYCGEEGDGKSKFIEILYKIFGQYAIQIDKAKKLYESHSTFEKEKIFLCVNEAGGCDNFENSEVLKTRITEDTLNINPKGIQPYEIDNLCDYDMTTNNLNVVKLTDDSKRRWFQTRTTGYYNGNTVFFNDLVTNILNNPIALRQIYEGLMKFDVKKIVIDGNFQSDKCKPDTEISKEVKECNRDKIIWWIEDYVNGIGRFEEEMIRNPNKEFFNNWCDWCDSNKVNIKYNSIQFGIKVKELGNKIDSKLKKKGIVKDTKHSTTTIYKEVIIEYIDSLNS